MFHDNRQFLSGEMPHQMFPLSELFNWGVVLILGALLRRSSGAHCLYFNELIETTLGPKYI